MLLVSKKPIRYNGRFVERATALVKNGTRVGMMWVSEKELHCHVCDKDFAAPVFEEGQSDHWGNCPHCQTPFIFAKVSP